MNQQPDKFFRDKLENYQRAVPTSAWERIAASQDKKKPYSGWLKFAASLLLVAGAGAIWLSIQPGTPAVTTLAGNQTSVPDASQPSEKPDAGKSDSAIAPLNANVRAATKKTTPAGKTTASALRSPEVVGEKRVQADRPAVAGINNDMAMRNSQNRPSAGSQPPEAGQNEMPAATVDTHAVTGVIPVAATAESVTLTYTTDDVSAYLNKNIDDEATDDDKKQSTLKKLLQKANDLKTNQDPFGELRQRKNEILALNFKNDKRGQKTRN